MAKFEKRVVSDLDGVVAHSQMPFIRKFNRRFGTNYTYANWTSFDFLTREAVRLSGESAGDVAAWLYSAEVVGRSSVVPGTREAIKELSLSGFEFDVVTSRPPNQGEMTHRWINGHLPDVRKTYIRSGECLSMRGDEFKVHMVGLLRAGVYIDDDPLMIDEVGRQRMVGKFPSLKLVILVDRPWNDRHVLLPGIDRAGNWKNGDYGWSDIVKRVDML